MEINGADLTARPVRQGGKTDGKTVQSPGGGLLGAALSDEQLRELEKLERAALGQKLLDAAVKKNNDALMEMGVKQEDRAPAGGRTPERSADEASLSKDSLASVMKEEDAALLRVKLSESFQGELRELESFRPSGQLALKIELAQLKELYYNLTAKILQDLPKDMHAQEAQHLNQAMVEALQKLADGKYPNLMVMLEQSGEKELANLLQATVFKQVTGKAVDPEVFNAYGKRTAGALYGRQEQTAAGREGGAVYGRAEKENPVRSQETGVLYRREDARGVRTDARYMEQVRSTERFLPRFPMGGDPLLEAVSGKKYALKHYTASDIESAEKFFSYYNHGGNMMESPVLTSRNEELLGFLMAQNMMKGEIFSEYAGAGKEISRDIRDILEKLTHYYLGRAQEESIREDGASGRFDGKAARKIYYQVMQLFHRHKKPQRTIEEGLRQALEEFYCKKEKPVNRKKRRYQEDAGFFEKTLARKSRMREWEEAKRALERDWEDFLRSIGQQGNELLQLAFSAYSPWGAMVEPEDTAAGKKAAHPMLLFLLAAGVMLFILILVMR